MITLILNSSNREIAKALVDGADDGTIFTLEFPPTHAVSPQPPVDYAMNAEPWEQVA